MDKPNLNTCSRDELRALYTSATAKLSQIAEAVSNQAGPRVITLRGRVCGQTTALVLKLTEENVANNAKLAAVRSILDGHDMGEIEWEGCQAIADLPDVDAALLAFADDPTGDQGVMVVRAVLRATQHPAADQYFAPIDIAKQRLQGFLHARSGRDLFSLASEMALTEEEWEVIRADCSWMPASMIQELDELFASLADPEVPL